MNQKLFNDIVDLLEPHMDSESARRSHLMRALNNVPKLLRQIDYSGSTHKFVVQLVNTLITYGDVNGEPALVLLLESLKAQVGTNKQEVINQLIIQINTDREQHFSTQSEAFTQSTGLLQKHNLLSNLMSLGVIGFVGVVVLIIAFVGFSQLNKLNVKTTEIPTIVASEEANCIADIAGEGDVLLNEVRQQPGSDLRVADPVSKNESVVVKFAERHSTVVWYRIEYRDTAGWIRGEFLELPDNCSI